VVEVVEVVVEGVVEVVVAAVFLVTGFLILR
jgi:hypothetical protein